MIISFIGVAGLVGLAGFFDPRYFQFSLFSYFSYWNAVRFFQRDAFQFNERTTPLYVASFVGILTIVFSGSNPVWGFAGFLGYTLLAIPEKESQPEQA